MERMRRLLQLAVLALALTACNPFSQSGGATPGQSGSAQASASPSAAFPHPLWVLSPVGLKLRDAPNPSGKQIATVPQGTQVSASDFKSDDPGWYQVTYQSQQGWIAARDTKSTPPQDLVSGHPQRSFANTAAGYYFLYPASWQTSEKGNDVEVSGASVGKAPSSTPAVSPSPTPFMVLPSGVSPTSGGSTGSTPGSTIPTAPGNVKLTVHLAASVDQLGNIPTAPGSNVSQDNYEVGGVTAVKHVYQLNGGGYEGDAKVKFASDRAILITFFAPDKSDLDTWNEILESFGFSVLPSPGASPSPTR
jgi:hypothetical protein